MPKRLKAKDEPTTVRVSRESVLATCAEMIAYYEKRRDRRNADRFRQTYKVADESSWEDPQVFSLVTQQYISRRRFRRA